MKTMLSLVKIDLLTFLDLYKIRNATTKEERMKAIGKLLLLLVCFGYLSSSIYFTSKLTMEGFIAINAPHLIIVQYMVITSSFILMTNIYRINSVLFKFKDYDLLMSLPIKKNLVLNSKLTSIYVLSMFFCLFLMIPSFVAYIEVVSSPLIFYILFFVTLLILPLVPMIVAVIIGVFISGISSNFKHKNIANYMVSLILVFGVMYLSFNTSNLTNIDLANLGQSMIDKFNSIYPLTNVYAKMLFNNDILSFGIYLLIPVILFTIFDFILLKFYDVIKNNLSKETVKSDYKISNLKITTPMNALYRKELYRYFSSPNYVLNTAMGVIMALIMVVALMIFGADKLGSLLEIEGLKQTIAKYAPIILGAFCGLNCSTNSSISLEGKGLWIIKSLPVKATKIFLSKILVNLTILIPSILVISVILGIYLKVDLITYLLLVITPIAYSVFISITGLILNLLFPNFDWKNELQVIKQSFPTFATMIIGLIMAVIPLAIESSLNSNVYTLIVTLVIVIIILIEVYYLSTKGVKKFREL